MQDANHLIVVTTAEDEPDFQQGFDRFWMRIGHWYVSILHSSLYGTGSVGL